MKYSDYTVIGSMSDRIEMPTEIETDLRAIENSINLEFIKQTESELDLKVRFEWNWCPRLGRWAPLLTFTWDTGKCTLDSNASDVLLAQPLHVVAERIRKNVVFLNGMNKMADSGVGFVDPISAGYEGEGDYGNGFWFNDDDLDDPDLSEKTKPYSERIDRINTFVRETISANVKISLNWEWHVKRGRWYPRVAVNWDASDFNLIMFDLDYSYRILTGEDEAVVMGLIANALCSLISIKN